MIESILEKGEYLNIIFGALLTLICSLILMIAQYSFSRLNKNIGKFKVYIKYVASQFDQKEVGLYEDNNDVKLSVPIWIEFQNTKEITEIVRDLNIDLYHNNKYLDSSLQINHFENSRKIVRFGEDGNYSFMISGESISKFELLFIIKKTEQNSSMNKVYLTYKNRKDKKIKCLLFKLEEGWDTEFSISNREWIQIN